MKIEEALETINQTISHLNAGLDELFETLKDVRTHQQNQDNQIAKLFNLYREIEIDLADLKRSTDKIKSIRILEEINEETKKLEGETECETEKEK